MTGNERNIKSEQKRRYNISNYWGSFPIQDLGKAWLTTYSKYLKQVSRWVNKNKAQQKRCHLQVIQTCPVPAISYRKLHVNEVINLCAFWYSSAVKNKAQ